MARSNVSRRALRSNLHIRKSVWRRQPFLVGQFLKIISISDLAQRATLVIAAMLSRHRDTVTLHQLARAHRSGCYWTTYWTTYWTSIGQLIGQPIGQLVWQGTYASLQDVLIKGKKMI